MSGPEFKITITGDASGANAAFDSVQAEAKQTADSLVQIEKAAEGVGASVAQPFDAMKTLALDAQVAMREAARSEEEVGKEAENAATELKEMLGNAYHIASQQAEEFSRSVKEAGEHAHGFAAGVEEIASKIPGIGGLAHEVKEFVSGPMGAMAASVAVLYEIGEALGEFAERAEQIEKLSIKTGESVEQIQKWSFAAHQSGSSVDTFAMGLQLLERNLGQVAAGSEEAEKKFEKWGIRVKDDEGIMLSQDEVMAQIADRMKETSSASERSAMAMELMGRAGREMIPILAKGSEELEKLKEKADVLTESEIHAGVELSHAINELSDDWRAFKDHLLAGLAPIGTALVDVFDGFLKAYQSYRKAWDDIFQTVGDQALDRLQESREREIAKLEQQVERIREARRKALEEAGHETIRTETEEWMGRLIEGKTPEEALAALEAQKRSFKRTSERTEDKAIKENLKDEIGVVDQLIERYKELAKEAKQADKERLDELKEHMEEAFRSGEEAHKALEQRRKEAAQQQKRDADERHREAIQEAENESQAIMAMDEKTASEKLFLINQQIDAEQAAGKFKESQAAEDAARAKAAVDVAKQTAADQNLSLDQRIAQLREEESILQEGAAFQKARAEIEKLINGLVFQRFQAEKGEAFARFEDVAANEVRVNELKLAYLSEYVARMRKETTLTYQQEQALIKETDALKRKLRDAEIKELLEDEKRAEKGQNRDLEKDIRDAQKRVQDRLSKDKDATAEQARLDELNDELFKRHEQSTINRIKNDSKLDADGKREALQQWLQHEEAKGDISLRTKKRIDRELAELERQRLAQKYPGMTEKQAREKEAQEAADAQKKAEQQKKEEAAKAQKQAEADQYWKDSMLFDANESLGRLQDILAAIKALKLQVTVNCTCDGDGSAGGGGGDQGGGKGDGGKGDGDKPATINTEAAKGLKDALNKAEDAKKSLAENIKSEFTPSKPGNALYALDKAGDSAGNLAEKLSDAHDAAAKGIPAIGDGGKGGDGGSSGGGAAAGPGASPGAGAAGGAGGQGGKGSKSSGGGGGGAGGAGGAGGKGGDATVVIDGQTLFGKGASEAALAGLANYRTRYLRETVGLQQEAMDIFRSNDPIAIRRFLMEHPGMFPGAEPGNGALASQPAAAEGGSAGTGGNGVRVDDRTPVRTHEVPTPTQETMDIARYRGGLATTRKVEDIAKLLYGVVDPNAPGGPALKVGMQSGSGPLAAAGFRPTINISLSGAHIGSEAEAKQIATALGREVQSALRMPSMRAV